MIEIRDLTKTYGAVRAVKGVSLAVETGEVFGLLGPNGAGKTTLIKMLTLLSRPDSGGFTIAGLDASRPSAIKRLIGVMPQENNLERELTAGENLLVYGMLHGLDGLPEKIEHTLSTIGLLDRKGSFVSEFSGGMQRRLLLGRALMTRPAVVFLDEPSIGLDPQIRRQMWDLIRKARIEGRTVVITTHYIEEAEALCDRVGILAKGSLVALGAPAELKTQVGDYVVEHVDEDGRLIQHMCKSRAEAQQAAGQWFNLNAEIPNPSPLLHPFDEGKAPAALPLEGATQAPVIAENGVTIRRSNLEDVFIKLTGERL